MLLMAGVSCIKACLEHRGRYTSGCYGAEPAGTCSLAYFTHINSLCPQVCVKDHTETKKKNRQYRVSVCHSSTCSVQNHPQQEEGERGSFCLFVLRMEIFPAMVDS